MVPLTQEMFCNAHDVLDDIHAVINTDLHAYDVVSFDVYDTAVLRKTYEPRDIFLLMQEKLSKAAEGSVYTSFAHRREIAEKELIEKVRAEDVGSEITLAEIYAALTHAYPEYTDDAAMLMALELETELAYTIPNPLIHEVYHNAIKQGKKVIFASDIYLPKTHLMAILAQCGYDTYHHLYVSCELKANKSSGSLFQHILKDLNLSANQVIHFGDNQWSDNEMAQQNGIASVKVPYSADFLEKARYAPADVERNIANSLYKGAIKNYLLGKRSHQPVDIGYELLGPLLYFFTDWVITHAQKQSINDIYFIAREGWFMQQVFDLIKDKRNLSMQSHYLLASRRSLLFPYIERDIEEGFARFLISSSPQKLSDYLSSIEITATDAEIKQAGFESTAQVIVAKKGTDDYHSLIALLKICAERIFDNADEEKSLYVKYLKSIGMIQDQSVAVVDSGWFGNGQKMLRRFLSDNGFTKELHGFYLALHRIAKEKIPGDDSIGHGFLYQYDTGENDTELFNEIAKVSEVLLSAPSESFKRFKENGDALVPVYINENGENQLAPAIAEVQRGALQFVQDQLAFDPEGRYMPDKALIKNMVINFIQYPRQYEAEILGRFPYESNMLQGEEKHFIDANNSVMAVLKDPVAAIESFNNSHWRAGYFLNTSSNTIRFFYKCASRYFYERTALYKLLRRVKNKVAA